MTGRGQHLVGLRVLPRASDLLPWSATNISVYPFGSGWWPFNPSIHRDPVDGRWRCLIRLANYTLPGGIPQLSSEARSGRARTRNVLADLDEGTLRPTSIAELIEPGDGPPRSSACTSMGLEDLRLFRTRADGLVAVGCALQHNLDHPNRPEIVVCRFGDAPEIAGAPGHQSGPESEGDAGIALGEIPIASVTPLRGPWGFRPQKNWVPFDGTDRIRLLYAIERGVVMTEDGAAPGSPAPVLAQIPRPASRQVSPGGRSGAEIRMFGRPVAVVVAPQGEIAERPSELRGGSQLVALSDGRWLGIAHEMTFSRAGRAKFYWHTLYTTDPAGRLLERSPALRLSGDHDIEFAAGLAVDGRGRLAVSYGTDDHEAWIATTELRAVLSLLSPASSSRDLAPDAEA